MNVFLYLTKQSAYLHKYMSFVSTLQDFLFAFTQGNGVVLYGNDYVSPNLRKSSKKHKYTEISMQQTGYARKIKYLFNKYDENSFKVITNLETALNMLLENLPANHPLVKQIIFFKDKYAFRELIKDLYPKFYFKQFDLKQLQEQDPNSLPYPIILKPVRGIASIGVYKIDDANVWRKVLDEVRHHASLHKNKLFSDDILSSDQFIVEEYICGDEYAIDAYVNKDGKPIILNAFKHLFKSATDTSDRLYLTNKDVIRDIYKESNKLLDYLSKKTKLKNVPVHLEFRINQKGEYVPIELNFLRFAGYGTTDIAMHAWNINVYDYFMEDKNPNWEAILSKGDNSSYAFLCFEVPKDIDYKTIDSINEETLTKTLNHLGMDILEFNKMPSGCAELAIVFVKAKDVEVLKMAFKVDVKNYIKLLAR